MKAYHSDSSKVLMISTSKIHGSDYMEYLLDEVEGFLGEAKELLFIPYARPGGISFDEYTKYPTKALAAKGIEVKGIHEFADPKEAIAKAQAIFVGGGNTFLLTKTLYELELIEALRAAVVKGIPYMGSSAGSNLTGLSIGTTNDMPIVYPPSFEALALVPFNINPHYLDPDPNSKHQGETRATRINEFHFQNSQAVIGLREGSWLRLEKGKLELKGPHSAVLFEAQKEMREIPQGDVSFLLG
ncbi:dipeptidase PepE [Croceimicrobium hydrocarbonivorans]|uniref:dipeptidase E n=1 Tax=Croceimicrobium hydrocarbonivorans TaxID=2761580 RepID=A0A7H0VGZ2_9FLAO|nr:dipeptidase PepE [Croceimicrobium hydrocarbonivorans]QNR24990.1 dipeptidase PepE [Croceimicrobium hydrocarbonivorans]